MSSTSTENGSGFSRHSAELSGKGADIRQDFKDLGKITGSLAGDAVNMVKENAGEYYDQGIRQAKIFGKSVESRIQKHPLQSLLIMAGAGLILGTLWNRR